MTTLDKPESPSLMRQISHYFGGQVAVMAAGFITMPVIMRLMTEGEYGLSNLIVTSMTALVALSKLGLSSAAVRFAGRAEPGKEREEAALQATLLVSAFTSSALFAAVVAAVAWVYVHVGEGVRVGALSRFFESGRGLAGYIMLASIILVPRTLTAVLYSLMRAEERSRLYNHFAIVLRYGSQIIGIGAFVAFRTLTSYIAGQVLSECVIVLWYYLAWWRSHHLFVRLFHMPDLRRSLRYGLPLIAFEVTSVILAHCDRFIVQYYLGAEAVGRYSAGYNVAELLPALLAFPVQLAIVPYCFRLWEEDGAAPTGRFVAASTARYVVAAFPAMALFSATAPAILYVMAGNRYLGSASVVPWVVAGQVLWMGIAPMVGMGFHVSKETSAYTWIQIGALALNLALNIALVPRVGFYGSAVATFATYVVVILASGLMAKRHLHVPWDWGSMARSAVLATAVGVLAAVLPLGIGPLAAVARVAIGALLYARILTPMDAHARWMVEFGARWLEDHGFSGRGLRWVTGIA